MVQIDWKKIMAITPETMTEQDKDDLYESAAWYLPDYSTDRKCLIHFVRIIQEILKFKTEQIDSLINELDDVAAQQGQLEAQDRQDFLEENNQLKEQLEYYRRLERDSNRPALNSNEELRGEIIKLEIQNEELLVELQEREKDLMKEKTEAENLASQVAVLEREKQELKKELIALQEDSQEQMNNKNYLEPSEYGPEKHEELMDAIRQKNKHITQLLDDLDLLDKQNVMLKSKLANVCDELSEATNHINEMTIHLSQSKHLSNDLEVKLKESEERNCSLMTQIEELVQEKAKHDEQLDQFGEILNSKVQEWKETLEAKDIEISKAHEEIKKLMATMSGNSEQQFIELDANRKVLEQEEQIMNLRNELVKATQEINNCTELIENFKEKQSQIKFPDCSQTQNQIAAYEEKITYLEEKLKYAEDDAQAKAEEISEIVIQLREYEMGEFGLPEAVVKIKKLEKILAKRDLQVEKLVESCNNLEIQFENLTEQNLALRERLGVTTNEEIDTSAVKLKFKKDTEIIENLKIHLDRKEEELIKAKLKCRKLIKIIKLKRGKTYNSISTSDESGKESTQVKKSEDNHAEEILNLEKRIMSILKENDALRKGMHEILESIHSQDGCGFVEIQSNCLERLLEALDSRHINGWYHPAMRLQAQLSCAEGKNEELRNQVRLFREEERAKTNELQEAYIRIRSLESKLLSEGWQQEEISSKSKTPESDAAYSATEDKRSLMNVEQEQKIVDLETEVQELKLSCNSAKMELEKLKGERILEKEQLTSEVIALKKQIELLESSSGEVAGDTGLLQNQVYVLERQVNFLKQLESNERVSNERLCKEMMEREEKQFQEVLRLQRDKISYILKIEKYEKELLDMVPRSQFAAVNRELLEVTMKYQDAVALAIAKYEDNAVEQLEEEIMLLLKEKNEILDELRRVKEKLLAYEESLEINGNAARERKDPSTLAEQLAAAEVRELNEKKKSAHLEKINLTLNSELQELESSNKELSKHLMELIDYKKKYQEIKRESLVVAQSHDLEVENNKLCEKVENLEGLLKIAVSEKENFQELFELSQSHRRTFENYREQEKLKITSLNEMVLLLQSSADNKAIVARLSQELLSIQLNATQLANDKIEIQDKVTKLLAQNLLLESKIEELRRESVETKRNHLLESEKLFRIIDEIRQLYGSTPVFFNIESMNKIKMKLLRVQEEERSRLKDLRNEIHEYTIKKEELQVQLESLVLLKESFKGDDRQLMNYFRKVNSLRLEEARSRRQNEYLANELSQMENYVKQMEQEMISREESNLKKQKNWEEKQIYWERSQLELLQLLQGKNVQKVRSAVCEDKAVETDHQETKKTMENQEVIIRDYENEIERLKVMLKEKEECINANWNRTASCESIVTKNVTEDAEKSALKVTVQSLQSIIKQKEQTIYRYQELLKEGREEYSKSSGKFQEEMRSLHEALTKQSKAYSKLKNSLETIHEKKENLPKTFEKYLTKIHELQDELTECRLTLTGLNNQLFKSQREVEKWRNIAEERSSYSEQIHSRLEGEYRDEIEKYKNEIRGYRDEIEQLQKHSADNVHRDGSGDHKGSENIVCPDKEIKQESEYSKEKEIDWNEERSPKSKERMKDIKTLERQLKFAKDESTRLREQLKLVQLTKSKRPKTASSNTSRSGSDTKTSLKEESLTSKVKTLEELLKIAKDREQDLIEGHDRKIKSAEEVARWGEKKKSQQTIQNLNSKLKEKEAEVDMLKSKNESFRNMIHKCERDKNSLEVQLKAAKGGPNSLIARVEKLTEEKGQLEKEVAELKNKLEIQLRHEGGVGAAVLHDKLESQERKLAVLELASQGRQPILDEMEKLTIACANLEKHNLRLETENLSLHLHVEKVESELKSLTERNGELEKMLLVAQEDSELRQLESERTISCLNEKIEKISSNKKSCRRSRMLSCPEKLKIEYAKLKEDHKTLRGKYLESVDRNRELEEELKKCRYQIHLLEEKDLADSISKTNNLQLASELSQELLQLRTQLTHKSHLLNRVKILLTKAAAKEKALNEKVSELQNLVPNVMTGSEAQE